MELTDNMWLAYLTETAYGGGKAGALHDHTAPTLATDLTKMDRVTSVEIKPAAPVREEQEDINAGMTLSDVMTLYTGPGEITIEAYLQTDDWYDLAIAGWGNRGSVPTSLTIHFDNGVTEKDLFGCVVVDWNITAAVGKPTKQTIKLKYSFIGDGETIDISSWSGINWQSGVISVHSNTSVTIDSITSANLQVFEMTETITVELLDGEEAYILGVDYMYVPAMKNLQCEFEVKYRERSTSTWGAFDETKSTADELNDAIHISISAVWHTTLTSVMSNMYLVETDSGNRTENGLVTHTASFKKGGDVSNKFAIA